jgi:hypothetical protein
VISAHQSLRSNYTRRPRPPALVEPVTRGPALHPKGSAMGKGNKTRKKEVKKPKQDKKSAPVKK